MSSCVGWKMNVEKGKRVEAEGPSVDSGKGPGEAEAATRGGRGVWALLGSEGGVSPPGSQRQGHGWPETALGQGRLTRASTLASNCTTGK